MEEPVKVYKLTDGREVRLYPDENALMPFEDDDYTFLVYDHKHFFVQRDGFDPRTIFDAIQESNIAEYDGYYVFVVYAYIHSGVSLSLSRGTDTWDTSSTGYVLIHKETQPDLSRDVAEEMAQEVIDIWNQYLEGDVYQAVLVSFVKCEHCGHIKEIEEESCGEFYGTDIHTNGVLDNFNIADFLQDEDKSNL